MSNTRTLTHLKPKTRRHRLIHTRAQELRTTRRPRNVAALAAPAATLTQAAFPPEAAPAATLTRPLDQDHLELALITSVSKLDFGISTLCILDNSLSLSLTNSKV